MQINTSLCLGIMVHRCWSADHNQDADSRERRDKRYCFDVDMRVESRHHGPAHPAYELTP